jgi:hypothetical protein
MISEFLHPSNMFSCINFENIKYELNNFYESIIYTNLETQEINWTVITSIIIALILTNFTALVIIHLNSTVIKDEQKKQNKLTSQLEIQKLQNDINAKMHYEKLIQIKKMMYNKSLNELNTTKININIKNSKHHIYQVLLRVQMKQPITLKNTKYELHSNNLVKSNKNGKFFTTKDMYMSFAFVLNPKYNMSANIISIMNYINSNILINLKTSDFIVLTISAISNTRPEEFYIGLVNINYELFNMYDIVCKKRIAQNSNIVNLFKVTYTLPVHEVYDMFLDAFNDIIFESKKYEIDDNNYESWNGKSINEIPTF